LGKRKKLFNRRGKSSVNLAFVALGLILLVIILGKFFQLLGGLTKPFSADTLVKKEYSWDGKSAINLAIKGKDVEVASFDPSSQKLTLLKIPKDAYFELPKGFGTWRVGAIYELGQEEDPPVGSELLKTSLAKLMGLPIDGFVEYKGDQPFKEVVEEWHSNPLKILGFIKESKTDLSPLEAIGVYRAISSVRADKVVTLDTAQSDITQSKLLPDSSRVLGVDTIRLDLYVRDKMPDSQILAQAVPVGILNGTSHPGLGQDVARIITNMGGNVIFVNNTESLQSVTVVVSKEKSHTATRLMEVFAPSCLKGKCAILDSKVSLQRAQINIVLGEDYYQKYYSR
jgi:hypothetical protein